MIASPVSLSMSGTWFSAASAFTTGLSFGFGYLGFQNGPWASPRFR